MEGGGGIRKGGILQEQPGWSKLAERAGLNFMARASCRSWRGGRGGGRKGERRAAIPFPSLDWADYTQVSAAARREKKKRITCVQIELSVWKREMQSYPPDG